MERVILLGNGLSIAASPDFRTSKLTKLVRAELADTRIGRRSLLNVLQLAGKHLVPDQATYRPKQNFEHLLGPLDRLADLFSGPLLKVLSDVVDDAGMSSRVGKSARSLYSRAVASVLKVILSVRADRAIIRETVDWLLRGVDGEDAVSIFTLNYDALLDSAIISASNEPGCMWRFDDEFAPTAHVMLNVDQYEIPLLPLREAAWARPNNVHLFHLHGGLHWVADDEGSDAGIFKLRDIDDLRRTKLLDLWIHGGIGYARPHVLLTDQKTRRVTVEPFASAYEALSEALQRADRVVVAGYGFGDKPLNRALADGCANRPSDARWLVVSKPEETRDERAKVARHYVRALHCTRNDVERCFGGLPVACRHLTFWDP